MQPPGALPTLFNPSSQLLPIQVPTNQGRAEPWPMQPQGWPTEHLSNASQLPNLPKIAQVNQQSSWQPELTLASNSNLDYYRQPAVTVDRHIQRSSSYGQPLPPSFWPASVNGQALSGPSSLPPPPGLPQQPQLKQQHLQATGVFSPASVQPGQQQQRFQPSQLPPPPIMPAKADGLGYSLPVGPPNLQPQPPAPSHVPSALPQQPQSRSLDPDQMPSFVQVIEDDRRKHTGPYETGQQLGLPPPLVTTEFVSVDRGVCSPRYIRSTLYSVPCTHDLLKTSRIPLGLAISPMASRAEGESPVFISDLGSCGPVRCSRCKAYMSPYMIWLDGGRRYQCAMCGVATETPESYFAHLDHTGRRVDARQRPELHLGSYELLASAEYCKAGRQPVGPPPGIIFAIDVSYQALRSGLTGLVCGHIKENIRSLLPTEEDQENSPSPLRVGFITYDRSLHYYNLNSGLSQPQMIVVTDLEEPFVPLLNGFLVSAVESESQILQLLDSLPSQFANTATEEELVLGPVIEGALDAFKAAGCPGKLLLFHSGLPTAEVPGRLKNRDDRKLLGTDKEKSILCPAGDYYTRLGQRCVETGVGVDMFVCCDAYVDLASIGQVAFTTGGSLYKYALFQAGTHCRQLTSDLNQSLRNCRAFDCVMRVRTSTGIRPVDFYGGMYMANATDVETGVFASDKAVTIELKHDDKLAEGQPTLVQCALLYTSVSGQRRIRVHNLVLATSVKIADIFRSADVDAVVNLVSKASLKMLLKRGPKETRKWLMSLCVGILAAYRKNCSASSSPAQLILPEVLKLLPLYINGIIKNDAFEGADISTDDRSYLMYLCAMMDVPASNVFFYPRLIPLHDLQPPPIADAIGQPSGSLRQMRYIRCSVERLSGQGAYLLGL